MYKPLVYRAYGKAAFGAVLFCAFFVFITVSREREDEDELNKIPKLKGSIFSNDGQFKLYPHVWTSRQRLSHSKPNVCLATQLSLNRLSSLPWIIESWKGPLSIAIFTPGANFFALILVVEYLKMCYPDISIRLSIHVATSRNDTLAETTLVPNVEYLECNKPQQVINSIVNNNKLDATDPNIDYPQNVLRNLARNTCDTPFCFTIDGDMIPSRFLFRKLNGYLQNEEHEFKDKVIVVPTYEVDDQYISKLPGNTAALLEYVHEGKARVYHVQDDKDGQMSSDLKNWEELVGIQSAEDLPLFWTLGDYIVRPRNIDPVRDLYQITGFNDGYEPFVVIHRDAPGWRERFVGFGLNRQSHIYELHEREYSFTIMDSGFLLHQGFRGVVPYSLDRIAAIKENEARFAKFKTELQIMLDNNK